jgi:hypothetical protein
METPDLYGELFPDADSESEVEVGVNERQHGLMSYDGAGAQGLG